MKKHLVIVCGVIYPSPSPTGLCSLRYASLLRNIYDIEFIAISSNGKNELATYDGFVIHTLSSTLLSLEHKASGFLGKLIHLIGSSQLKTSILGNLGWYGGAAYRKLDEIHHERPIDALLTVCSPFPSHIAGAKFKQAHPEIRFGAYTVDPFATSERIVPFLSSFDDFVKLERNVSCKADCLFLSEEAIKYRQDIYGDIVSKVSLPYLLPEVKKNETRTSFNERIHCVYAGSFYKDIRNPEYMLKVFSALNNKRIILHLYSTGCDDVVLKYARRSEQIQLHDYVTQEELQQVYASCDFLIGVGNAVRDFLPSKTYEYLALRRAIIFFNPKGFENKVLEKYPHSLQIEEDDDLKDAVRCLEAFIESEHGKTISKDELFAIYNNNTPNYVREVLINGLNGNE